MLRSHRQSEPIATETTTESHHPPGLDQPLELGAAEESGLDTPLLELADHSEHEAEGRLGTSARTERGRSSGLPTSMGETQTVSATLSGRTQAGNFWIDVSGLLVRGASMEDEAFRAEAQKRFSAAIQRDLAQQGHVRPSDERLTAVARQHVRGELGPHVKHLRVEGAHFYLPEEEGSLRGEAVAPFRERLGPLPMSLTHREGVLLDVRVDYQGWLHPLADAVPVAELHKRRRSSTAMALRSVLWELMLAKKASAGATFEATEVRAGLQERIGTDLESLGWALGKLQHLRVVTEEGLDLAKARLPEAKELGSLGQGTGALSLATAARGDQVAWEENNAEGEREGLFTAHMLEQMQEGASFEEAAGTKTQLSTRGGNHSQSNQRMQLGGQEGDEQGIKRSAHVGVGAYRRVTALKGTHGDARNLASHYASRGYDAKLELDPEVAEMRAFYQGAVEASGDGDTLVMSFAGHGSRDDGLLAQDFRVAGPTTGAMPWGELTALGARASAKGAEVDILIDACHSGEEVEAAEAGADSALRRLGLDNGGATQALYTIRHQLAALIRAHSVDGRQAGSNVVTKEDADLLHQLTVALSNYTDEIDPSWLTPPGGALSALRLTARVEVLQALADRALRESAAS